MRQTETELRAGIIKMKRELDKKIKQICDEVGGAAAEAKLDDVTRIMNDQYDKIVESGKTELDAYRALLADTEKIREMFNSIPQSEQKRNPQGESEKSSRKKKNKKEKGILDTIETSMWLLIVIFYFLFSMRFGHWNLSWLVFLWGSIGSVLIGMVKKYNRGESLRRTMKKGISKIMWLYIVIIYFAGSFIFGGWAVSWVIFLVGALAEVILNAIFRAFGETEQED